MFRPRDILLIAAGHCAWSLKPIILKVVDKNVGDRNYFFFPNTIRIQEPTGLFELLFVMAVTIDEYCIRIPRAYVLRPKPNETCIRYEQRKIECYLVTTRRDNFLRLKPSKVSNRKLRDSTKVDRPY